MSLAELTNPSSETASQRKLLAVFVDALKSVPDVTGVVIAYSGGVDSRLLLQLCALLAPQLPAGFFRVLHINHQLQAQAEQWAEHCRVECEQLGLALCVERVDARRSPRQSPEDAARKARYRIFESALAEGELLLQGHHRDDQAETLLLRLLRGAGTRGLAAIPVSRPLGRGLLLRPLLAIDRADIEVCAGELSLQWVDDPSNTDTDYDRNYLRQKLLPLLASRWPGYRLTLARAAGQSAESEQLLSELAELDALNLGLDLDSASLSIAVLKQLSGARQRNLLRLALTRRGLPLPSRAQMESLQRDVIAAAAEANPLLCWPGGECRRFQGDLYLMAPLPPVDADAVQSMPAQPGASLTLHAGGTLCLKAVTGAGLRADKLAGFSLQLRYRRGGERYRPAGGAGSRSIKKLLQESRVPTWQRDRLPLIYAGDDIIAVADLVVCEDWQAVDDQPGLQFFWQFAH